MRKTLFPVIALAASMAWGLSASASPLTKKVNAGSSVYVRTAPNAFVIGTLFADQKFSYDTNDASGSYRYGQAFTNEEGKCGWVNINYFYNDPAGYTYSWCTYNHAASWDSGKPARQYLRQWYAKAVNDYVPGPGGPNNVAPFFLDKQDGSEVDIVISATVYGNYNTTTDYIVPPDVYYFPYSAQNGFMWRWISDGGRVVLGRVNNGASSGNGIWGFVTRDSIGPIPQYHPGIPSNTLPYADGIWRADYQAGL